MVWCLSHGCHRIAFRNNSNTKVAPRSRKRHVKRCYFATPRDSRPTVEQIVPQAHESHQTRLPSTGPRTATFWSLGDSDWMLAGKGANGNIVGDKCAWNARSSKEGSCICWLRTCMRRRFWVATALRASNRGRVSFEQRSILSTGIPLQGSKQAPM
jgi:hypothetical protein